LRVYSAAPPEELAHNPSQMPLSCPSSAPGRPELIELQASASSPTPTRAEDHRALQKSTPPKDDDRQDMHFHAPVLRRVLHVLALHVSTATATGPAAPTTGFGRSRAELPSHTSQKIGHQFFTPHSSLPSSGISIVQHPLARFSWRSFSYTDRFCVTRFRIYW